MSEEESNDSSAITASAPYLLQIDLISSQLSGGNICLPFLLPVYSTPVPLIWRVGVRVRVVVRFCSARRRPSRSWPKSSPEKAPSMKLAKPFSGLLRSIRATTLMSSGSTIWEGWSTSSKVELVPQLQLIRATKANSNRD